MLRIGGRLQVPGALVSAKESSEDLIGSLLVLPQQFHQRGQSLMPEQLLLVAFLNQALEDITGRPGMHSTLHKRRQLQELISWFVDKREYPFSFLYVCRMLQLDEEKIIDWAIERYREHPLWQETRKPKPPGRRRKQRRSLAPAETVFVIHEYRDVWYGRLSGHPSSSSVKATTREGIRTAMAAVLIAKGKTGRVYGLMRGTKSVIDLDLYCTPAPREEEQLCA